MRVGRRLIECAGTTKPSRRWTATWCVGGRTKARTLKTTRKTEAIREAFELYQQLRAGKSPLTFKPLTVEQLCALYLAVIENKGRSIATLRAYRNTLARFQEWAKLRGIVVAAALTEDDLWAFKKWLLTSPQRNKSRKAGVSPRTVYFHLIVVKQLTKWALRTGKLPSNPFMNAEVEEPPHVPQPVFTHDQVGLLVGRASEPWGTLWMTFALTGMRFGEVADLEWSNVLFNEGTHGIFVVVKGGSAGTTKNKRAREVPIHPQLRPLIEALPRRGPRVFMSPPSARRPKWGRMNERTVLGELKRQCAACKFDNAHKAKIHSFRHTFLSQLAKGPGSERYALDFLGHKDSDVTRQYFKRYDPEAERQIAGIHYPIEVARRQTPAPGGDGHDAA